MWSSLPRTGRYKMENFQEQARTHRVSRKIVEGYSLMLNEALKNYMDTYIKFYQEAFGKYPQVDAEISEEPSVCFFGEKDEDGYIQWKYVE